MAAVGLETKRKIQSGVGTPQALLMRDFDFRLFFSESTLLFFPQSFSPPPSPLTLNPSFSRGSSTKRTESDNPPQACFYNIDVCTVQAILGIAETKRDLKNTLTRLIHSK